jgi:predicted phosphodiesterase
LKSRPRKQGSLKASIQEARLSRQSACLEIDDEVLLFGGPYSNLEATEALFLEAARLRIPPERMICTGDLAAYCADPAATIELVRQSGIHVVMGNCDEQLAIGAADCGCGFASGSACERLSSSWFAFADAQVGSEARAWLGTLPRRIDLLTGGKRLAVIHGGVEQVNQFIFASSSGTMKRRQIESAEVDGVLGGHCGLPFTQMIADHLWHNAGVIGIPANDGTPRVWYSLIRPKPGGLEVGHRPLTYDHGRTSTRCASPAYPTAMRMCFPRASGPAAMCCLLAKCGFKAAHSSRRLSSCGTLVCTQPFLQSRGLDCL